MDGRPGESLDVLDAYFTRHADDAERLLLAMRMIYDARSANQPIQTIDADRARFGKYYEAYSKISGADLTQAQRWKAFVDRSSATR
jgi:hypothetical protein